MVEFHWIQLQSKVHYAIGKKKLLEWTVSCCEITISPCEWFYYGKSFFDKNI